jgi:hypothetical protein
VDDLLGVLIGWLLEFFGEFVLQMLFELAADTLFGLFDTTKRRAALSMITTAMSGAIAGLLSAGIFPHRLFPASAAFPGASVVFAPFAAGIAMYIYGNGLRRMGREPSPVATFRGGILFAFSMAAVRWWFVGMSR